MRILQVVHQKNVKMGELAHYPPCCPGLFFFGIDEGYHVKVINKNPYIYSVFASSHTRFWDMLRQNGELARYPRES